ncbi:unnamed protein product, partial [Didymodactylos carnosus]
LIIESVVIQRKLRGQGYGQILMSLIESELVNDKSFGIADKALYLTTTDQCHFYKKCGFNETTPRVRLNVTSKLFENNRHFIENLLANKQFNETSSDLILQKGSTIKRIKTVWMMKQLEDRSCEPVTRGLLTVFMADNGNSVRELLKDTNLRALLKVDQQQQRSAIRESMLCFHGACDREASEKILKENYSANHNKNGIYLLRQSRNDENKFVLSLIKDGQCYHYLCHHKGNGTFLDEKTDSIFFSLEELVEYYQNDGSKHLKCSLSTPVRGQPLPPFAQKYGHSTLLHQAATEGNTPLHEASFFGREDAVKELLNAGASWKFVNRLGWTSLHQAARGNCPTIIDLLVTRGHADVDCRNSSNSFAPIHCAAACNFIESVTTLFAHNSPVRPLTENLETPYDLAVKHGARECITKLGTLRSKPALSRRSMYYHGFLTNRQMRAILNYFKKKDGYFFVRQSSSVPNNYAISLVWRNNLVHVKLHKKDNHSYYFDDQLHFHDSLEHAVDFFMKVHKHIVKPLSPEEHLVNPLINKKVVVIQDEQLTYGKLLGEGNFGKVYEGTYHEQHGKVVPVAIKALKGTMDMKALEEMKKEAYVMKELMHPCIVRLYGIANSKRLGCLLMVQELLSMGSMLDYLYKHPGGAVRSLFSSWITQINHGMAYMEKKHFVHRDLAARNILMQSQIRVKISDFGLSRRTSNNDYYIQRSDTPIPIAWYAPESLFEYKFTSKSDVWSFGITMWEIYTHGQYPYETMEYNELCDFIQRGGRLPPPKGCSRAIYNIMYRCWAQDAHMRPSFADLLKLFATRQEFRAAIQQFHSLS